MSQSMCSRCLSRSYLSIESSAASSPSLNAVHRAAFSTSSALAANPPKKKSVSAAPSTRQGGTLRLNKNKRETSGRPPAPGERKALRQKLVLSNTNALEVEGLQNLDRESSNAAKLAELEGQVLGLTDANISALRTLDAFKLTQAWHLFKRPATVVRRETVQLAEELERSENPEAHRSSRPWVLYGEKGSGKSTLQLQAIAMALNKGWVVIHIPNGQDLANGQTSYHPDDEGKLYVQPNYTANLLSSIAKANEPVLSTMQLREKHDLPIPVQANISLSRFAELGARDPEVALPIFKALMRELILPTQPKEGEGQHRPPLLLGFDSIDHVMRPSKYLDSDAKPIHAHDLALVQIYSEFMTGARTLKNGGIVLAAISESNRASSPSLDHVLAQKHASQKGKKNVTRWDAYAPFDERVQEMMAKSVANKVEGLTKAEAKGLMEYYAKSGLLRGDVTDRLVGEKWSLSGGGVIGELERATVRIRV